MSHITLRALWMRDPDQQVDLCCAPHEGCTFVLAPHPQIA
jgi:hypothetical protein